MKESQLDNKTAIATNDYVRMVDENGNSVKIKKDSFMAAIRDAFPSIISDGETGGGSVLSIIDGALKTRTDANLASVLGAVSNKGDVPANSDIGDFVTPGIWSFNQELTGTPSGVNSGTLVVYKSGIGGGGIPIVQTIYCAFPGDKAGIYMRQMWGKGNWLNWQRIDNYGTSSLSELASALGVGSAETVTSHDSEINTRHGGLKAFIQEQGVSGFTMGEASTIEFGNSQIITYMDNGNIVAHLRVFLGGQWYIKQISLN